MIFFEWSMIFLAFIIGVYALGHGYLKHHRQILPLVFFCVGFGMLVAKEIFNEYELTFLFPAVLLIITAHFFNYRFCKKSRCSSPAHQH